MFYVLVPITAACLGLCPLIKDRRLTRLEGKCYAQELSSNEAGVTGESDMEMQGLEASKKS